MNNKQKRKYMSDVLLFNSVPFMAEFQTRTDFLKLAPNSLFKFRPFDEHTFEMIENNYAYLAPVKGLDDPFDCLSNFDIDDFYNRETNKLTPKAIDYVIKLVCPNGIPGWSPKEIRKLAIQCIDENGIDYERVPQMVTSNGTVTITQAEPLFVILNTFNQNFKDVLDNADLYGFAKNAMYPDENVRILSLSETRDNKVMWSLYGSKYKGYCVEYRIPAKKDIILNLCPVIYTKKDNNSFIKKMIEYAVSSFLRSVSCGSLTGNIGAAMELFCTKDSDWSYQREWRLIGKAEDKYIELPVKAVYLGFNVDKNNEIKMKQYSKTLGFDLYKMKTPCGKKKIVFDKI